MDVQFVKLQPYPWVTTNAFFLSDDRSVIIKVHQPKRRTFRLRQYRALRLLGYPSPYEFRSEKSRCQHERKIYAHWHAKGYSVPRLVHDFPLPLSVPSDRCIVLEFIKGKDLWMLLGDKDVAVTQRLACVASLFEECHERHARVFAERDRGLIKYDANLRNIVVREGELFYIDFEAGRIAESLTRGAMREISRYAKGAVERMGSQFSSTIVDLLHDRYRHRDVLRRIANQSQSQHL